MKRGKTVAEQLELVEAIITEALLARKAGEPPYDGKVYKMRIIATVADFRSPERVRQALAQVGIIALVDEATGFQNERAGDALQELLKAQHK